MPRAVAAATVDLSRDVSTHAVTLVGADGDVQTVDARGRYMSEGEFQQVRPFVPDWLQGEAEAGGFVRGYQAQLDEVYRQNPVGLRAVRSSDQVIFSAPRK